MAPYERSAPSPGYCGAVINRRLERRILLGDFDYRKGKTSLNDCADRWRKTDAIGGSWNATGR